MDLDSFPEKRQNQRYEGQAPCPALKRRHINLLFLLKLRKGCHERVLGGGTRCLSLYLPPVAGWGVAGFAFEGLGEEGLG